MKKDQAEKVAEELFESFFTKERLTEDIRRLALQGFDTFEDYEKYGDAFVPISLEDLDGQEPAQKHSRRR